jgi:hypothetical protein
MTLLDKPRRRRRVLARLTTTLALVLAAIGAAVAGTAAPAKAAMQYVPWYGYPGFESSWLCNTTGSFFLGDQGWAYVQACISVNGEYQQGLYNVRFSQAHQNVSMYVYDEFVSTGKADYDDTAYARQCSGPVNYSTTLTCFAQTIDSRSAGYAYSTQIVVDGHPYSLGSPQSGPPQEGSPTSNVPS